MTKENKNSCCTSGTFCLLEEQTSLTNSHSIMKSVQEARESIASHGLIWGFQESILKEIRLNWY